MANIPNARPSILWKIVHLEPAVYRGLIVAVVGLLASVGVFVSPDIPDNLILLIGSLAATTQALWTRAAVVAEDKVVAYLENPATGTRLKAGPAVPAAHIPGADVDAAVYQKAA